MSKDITATLQETRKKTLAQRMNIRNGILALEERMKEIPGAMIGHEMDDHLPLKHTFAPGVYVREIFIPKGILVVGKIHKHAHPNFLMSGDVSVLTEEGPVRMQGPKSMISPAGTKRVVYAHEDTVWITVHLTGETDLERIEEDVIAKDYTEVLTEQEEVKLIEFMEEVKQGGVVL